MNPHTTVGACVVVILVLVACSPESGGTTTSTAAGTTTASTALSSSTTSTTDGGDTTTTILPTPPGECFFLKQYVVTPQDGVDGSEAAVTALGAAGVPATALESVAAIDDFSGSPAAGQIDDALDIIDVDTENPLAAALILNAAQIQAGPVYVTGLAAHWSAKPGTDPVPSVTPIEGPTDALGDGAVAVVDSGLTDPLPDWMSPEHVLRDPAWDMETIDNANPASHGSFVSSLIRYLAPEHRVAFARARPVPAGEILENNHPLPPDVSLWSSELHVAEAMFRILSMDLPDISALNLSLGAYTCAPGADPTLITTVAALNRWFEVFPNSTVFAAGGNEVPASPLWPAALSTLPHPLSKFDPSQVRGVAAINSAGAEVIWQRPATNTSGGIKAMKPPARPWVNNVAPGCDLVGMRGGSLSDTVVWSGSSFATAVSAALYAQGHAPASTPVTPSDQDYTAVADIHEDKGSCVIP